jgi:hypothetical protein
MNRVRILGLAGVLRAGAALLGACGGTASTSGRHRQPARRPFRRYLGRRAARRDQKH